MEDRYFIIHSGEDGIVIDGPLDAAGVADRIEPEEGLVGPSNYYGTHGFHSEVPQQDNGHFWSSNHREKPHEKLLIIKGEIIVPQPVAKIVEYKL